MAKLKTPLHCGICLCGCGTSLFTNWSGQYPTYVNGHAARLPGGFPDGVKIDPEDAEKWTHLHWRITVKKSPKGKPQPGYVVASPRSKSEKRNYVFLHRMIMGDPPLSTVIDHINGDALDNRKSNLRMVDQMANIQNRTPIPGRVRGVSWNKKARRWYAFAKIKGKMISLGIHSDYDEAVRVATEYRQKHYAGWIDRENLT